MALRFALFAGVAYLLLALIELLFPEPFGGQLHFSALQNSFHWIVALILLVAAVKKHTKLARSAALLIGVIFLGVFFLDLVAPTQVSDFLKYPITPLYSALYLVTGVVGVSAAFVGGLKKISTVEAPDPLSSTRDLLR